MGKIKDAHQQLLVGEYGGNFDHPADIQANSPAPSRPSLNDSEPPGDPGANRPVRLTHKQSSCRARPGPERARHTRTPEDLSDSSASMRSGTAQTGTRDGGESAPGDDPVVQILCTRSPTDRIVGRKCPKLTYRINARESKNPGHTACARVIRLVRRQGLEPRTR
jgi:hypothetical protein